MKIFFTIFLSMCFLNTVNGQNDTLNLFNVLSQNNYAPSFSQAVEITEGGYLLVGTYLDSSFNRTHSISKVDIWGNELWVKDFDDGQFEDLFLTNGERVIKNKFGNIVIAYAKNINEIELKPLIKIVELDNEGELVNSKLLGDSSVYQYSNSITEMNNGYALASSYKNAQCRLFILDEQFDTISTKLYDESIEINRIESTYWDNGLLLSGRILNETNLKLNTFITKLDSLGETQWEFIYSESSEVRGSLVVFNQTEATYDPDLPIEYVLLTDREQYISEEEGIRFVPELLKLDENGSLIDYNNKLDISGSDFITAILSDHNEITAIIRKSYDEVTLGTQMLNISFNDMSVNWEKDLRANSDYDVSEYIYDLQKTNDGGFIMPGAQNRVVDISAWWLKTDSLGNTCGDANCGEVYFNGILSNTTVIENTEEFINVYPNPCTERLRINSADKTSYNYFIYDASMNVVAKGNTQNEIIEVSHYPEGFYFLVLENGETYKFLKTKKAEE